MNEYFVLAEADKDGVVIARANAIITAETIDLDKIKDFIKKEIFKDIDYDGVLITNISKLT